ncbi:MAG TPA: DUF1656 domain-containing protein [Methylophaga aminisulfidivorans]|uniref:DUF1656 domain-containing protein n=1 Tax=Methylophaga aminisulfidivorans TaxID=230105 RepID=A0A7C1ZRC4_9GAMM|nr:DUF1656 domain-containing protein [Methylophaga aminisulfidivorans]HEC73805.1 DUF1656 domain-containing protein [Methylophaga aminisulfidivorans]
MLREWSLAGATFPAITGLFVLSLLVLWLVDKLIGRMGVYRYVWHPSLFKLCLFVCIYSLSAFWVYQ